MIETLRALPKWLEAATVVAVAFGLFIYSSTYEAFEPSSTAYAAGDLVFLAQFEIVVGTLLLAFLFVRGWRLDDLGIQAPQWSDALHALFLVLALIAVSSILLAVSGASSGPNQITFNQDGLFFGTGVLFSLVNAAYEEVFVCAYMVAASRPLGLAPALFLSTALRLSYHTYQDAISLFLIVSLGLVFAWYFAKRGRLFALIAVHAVFDVLALLPYMRL